MNLVNSQIDSLIKEFIEEVYCVLSDKLYSKYNLVRQLQKIDKHTPCKNCLKKKTRIVFHTKKVFKINHQAPIYLKVELDSGEEIEFDLIQKFKKRTIFLQDKVVALSLLDDSRLKMYEKIFSHDAPSLQLRHKKYGTIRIRNYTAKHNLDSLRYIFLKKYLFNLLSANIENIQSEIENHKISQYSDYKKKQLINIPNSNQGGMVTLDKARLVSGFLLTSDSEVFTNDQSINPRYDFVSGINSCLFLTPYDIKNAIIKTSEIKEILESGVVVSGRNAHNYFHSLIEDLPALFATRAKIASDEVLIVSERIPSAIIAILKTFFPENPIKRINPDFDYIINKPRFPVKLFQHHDSTLKDWRLGLIRSTQIFTEFRNAVLENVQNFDDYRGRAFLIVRNSKETYLGRNLILTRPARRYLAKLGIEHIDFANLKFEDQVSLFQNAKVVITASGSACANIIFANSRTKIVVCVNKYLEDFAIWKNLGEIAKTDVQYLTLPSVFENSKLFNPYLLMHSSLILTKRKLRLLNLESEVNVKTKVPTILEKNGTIMTFLRNIVRIFPTKRLALKILITLASFKN